MSEVEIMPNLDGITGYFDMSSVDLINNKWVNRISGGNDIDLPNGGTINNDMLYLTAEQYGQFEMSTEPQTIYCVFKVITLKNTWSPIISKQVTNTTNGYGFWVTLNTSNYITMTSSSSTMTSSVIGDDYHVVCITKNGTTGYLYIDGALIGTITAKYGNYGGNCYINRLYRGSFVHTPTDVKFKMCAFGYEYHTEDKIKENTTVLITNEKLKYLRLAGTDAVAIAYAIARNQESAAALQEIKKAYRDGTLNGDDENTTEEYTDDGSKPIEIEQDPNKDPDPDKKPTSPGITDMSENGGVFYIAETDGETPEQYYIKIYTDGETGSDTAGEGTGRVSYVYTYHLCYAIYYADGTLKTSGTFGGNGGISRNYWYYKVRVNGVYTAYYWISGVSINGNKYTVTISGLTVSTGKQTTEQITGTFTSLPDNLNITTTTNVKPF